jgi:hypothetical protein|tara:strand:- start:259 stop:510 length:252 start_codon:yes stop_codon:yes gene_type:complete
MYAKLTDEVIMEVLKIFLDAGVQEVPNPSEIREEFEIIDKVYITEQMIKSVEYNIACHLDKKYNTGDRHADGLAGKWKCYGRD